MTTRSRFANTTRPSATMSLPRMASRITRMRPVRSLETRPDLQDSGRSRDVGSVEALGLGSAYWAPQQVSHRSYGTDFEKYRSTGTATGGPCWAVQTNSFGIDPTRTLKEPSR
jgi:hypothetical protein